MSVLSYEIDGKNVGKISPLNTEHKSYYLPALKKIKEELGNTKNKLDKYYNDRNPKKVKLFDIYWKQFDPFKNEKALVAQIGNTYNVSNAWIKCYELLEYYKMIPQEMTEDFIHFDNAAFPGSFIVATHHYVATRRNWIGKYKWYGSSLIEANDQDKEPLEDKYNLYKNYPSNWLMTKDNNGDVLSIKNQLDFAARLPGTVSLYTSDLGFDVSEDYNNQEILQAPANIGQIVSGIMTLKKGGCFITKQYTTFESVTISIMYAVSSFFDKFYICKPYTSREANSETYLIGVGFIGREAIAKAGNVKVFTDHPYIQEMFKRMTGETNINIPLFLRPAYSDEFFKLMIDMSKDIFMRQVRKINDDIQRIEKAMANRGVRPMEQPVVIEFNNHMKPYIEKWYILNKILPVAPTDKLNMKDAFGQKY